MYLPRCPKSRSVHNNEWPMCVTLRKTFIHLLLHSGLLVWKKCGIYSREIFFLSGEKSNFVIYLNQTTNQKFSKLTIVDFYSHINFYPLFLIIKPTVPSQNLKDAPYAYKVLLQETGSQFSASLLPFIFLKEVLRTLLADDSALYSGDSAIRKRTFEYYLPPRRQNSFK